MKYLGILVLTIALACCETKPASDSSKKVDKIYVVTIYSGGKVVKTFNAVDVKTTYDGSWVRFRVLGSNKRVRVYGTFTVENSKE